MTPGSPKSSHTVEARTDWAEVYACRRCRGLGHVDSWGDVPCRPCRGRGYKVPPHDVAAMVDKAIDKITEGDYGDCDVNPLHVRNVIMNARIGPELDYLQVKHHLARSDRSTYLRTTRDIIGSMPYYRVAA